MDKISKIYSEYESNPIGFMKKYKLTTTREITIKLMELAVSEMLLAYENYTSEIITGKRNERTAKSLVNDFLDNNSC